VASTASKTFPGSANEPFNFLNLDFYAQDTWRVTPRLTWIIGVRGGTAIAPGVHNSAVDATIAANQRFSAGFPQGELSCVSAQANQATCLPPVAITAVPNGKLHAPYFMQWSFGIQHQFGATAKLQAQYVGTRAVDQPATTTVCS
jgi:hypothetical protein